MKIAIDCRYLGKSGIGRLCEGLLDNLDYSANTFYLVGKADRLKKYYRAIIIEDDTNPFSKQGLFAFNKKRVNAECDALIIPNFIIPMGIKIPVHTVMHDLIFLDVKESVNGKIDYAIKKYLLKRCMKKSQSIACVSEFTKSRCEYYFEKYTDKCYVDYSSIGKDLIEYGNTHSVDKKTNTVVFVGNVKRHKGLDSLLAAFSLIPEGSMTLKIIGQKEGFLTGLDVDESAFKNVEFTGALSDEQLFAEIQNAKYLVQPSIYEGFGLPPLEALYLGTQPIISEIDVFKEVYYGLPVIFFKDEHDLAQKMQSEPQKIDCKRQVTERYNFLKFAHIMLKHI